MNLSHEVQLHAAQLILDHQRSTFTRNDRECDAWLNQDPGHRAAFLRLSAAWKTTEALGELRTALGGTSDFVPDNSAACRHGVASEAAPPVQSRFATLFIHRWRAIVLAAVAVPGSAAGWLVLKVKSPSPHSLEVGLTVSISPHQRPREASAAQSGIVAARADRATSRIVFSETTLAAAVNTFNARNARKLVLTDVSLSQVRIGGTFQADDPERFALSLEPLLDVRVVMEGEVIRIERR